MSGKSSQKILSFKLNGPLLRASCRFWSDRYMQKNIYHVKVCFLACLFAYMYCFHWISLHAFQTEPDWVHMIVHMQNYWIDVGIKLCTVWDYMYRPRLPVHVHIHVSRHVVHTCTCSSRLCIDWKFHILEVKWVRRKRNQYKTSDWGMCIVYSNLNEWSGFSFG